MPTTSVMPTASAICQSRGQAGGSRSLSIRTPARNLSCLGRKDCDFGSKSSAVAPRLPLIASEHDDGSTAHEVSISEDGTLFSSV
jgi:hypothetical protein